MTQIFSKHSRTLLLEIMTNKQNQKNIKKIFEKGFDPSAVGNIFRVRSVRFFSKDLEVLSLFQGLPFDTNTIEQ
ncbi:MAG: hypothetical protein Ta2E_11180 [Mycoplasmoidaceae bacterium]|nr:MAG: hypothetical protein Ta2E_11180 [Mycoplasmoidaceae bacterium]